MLSFLAKISDPFDLPIVWGKSTTCAVTFGSYLGLEHEGPVIGVEPFAPGVWVYHCWSTLELEIVRKRADWIDHEESAKANATSMGFAWPMREQPIGDDLYDLLPVSAPCIAGHRQLESIPEVVAGEFPR